MLDGLLGRGFAARCKSLIKLTKNRIDIIRRKRKATEKFLKEDVADLLANGLDVNAYGRAEGLIDELTLSWCYDFVEQSCDFVLKHLSVLQKLSGCPEECRETVSTLMFAAARFSDLPELRDLRQIFQERYGSSLECYVNQEFAANLNSKSSTLEKKIRLMQDIASEFSVKWDSKAFELRMSKSSTFAQGQGQNISKSNHSHDYIKPSHGKDAAQKGVKYDVPDHTIDGHKFQNGKDTVLSKRDGHDRFKKSRHPENGLKPPNSCDEVILKRDNHGNFLTGRQELSSNKSDRGYLKEGTMLKPIGNSSQDKRMEQFEGGSNLHDNLGETFHPRESQDTATARKSPSHAGLHLKSNVKEPFHVNHRVLCDTDNSNRKIQKDETPRIKSFYNNAIPPPYVKSNSKQKNSTHGANLVSIHNESDGIPTYPSVLGKPDAASASERIQLGVDNSDQGWEASRHVRLSKQNHEKDLSIHDDATEVSVSKPKSMRRKHSRSRSSHNDACNEDNRVVRKSRSRRQDNSRRGLQILFDDERNQNDEEERIIDKLLIHYSKKPSIPVPEKARRKSKGRHAHQMDDSAKDGTDGTPEMVTLPPRSVSLPHEQTGAVDVKKVFTRAASFQPDRSNEARHVHPKLPDYDDLAAKLAALRGT